MNYAVCCNINNAHVFSYCCNVGEKVGEGFVHITTEETQESKFDIVMFVYVENLPRKTFFKKVIS